MLPNWWTDKTDADLPVYSVLRRAYQHNPYGQRTREYWRLIELGLSANEVVEYFGSRIDSPTRFDNWGLAVHDDLYEPSDSILEGEEVREAVRWMRSIG